MPVAEPSKQDIEPQAASASQQCQREAARHHRRFNSVPALSSDKLVGMMRENRSFVLVDVRTHPEREVSIIQGAISLNDVHRELVARFADNDKGGVSYPTIVVYCTIGFRSGMEATRLKQLYPFLKIMNLDGIIAYSHEQQQDVKGARPLVDTSHNIVHALHVFSSSWDLAHPKYAAIKFNTLSLIGRLIQVVANLALRTFQSVFLWKAPRSKENQIDLEVLPPE